MPPKRDPLNSTNDVFNSRISQLEDQVRRLTTNKIMTAPIYDQDNLPGAAIDGQLMVGLNDRIHAYGQTSQEWHGAIHQGLLNETDYVSIETTEPAPTGPAQIPVGGGFNVRDSGGGINFWEIGGNGIILYCGTRTGLLWPGGTSGFNNPILITNDGGQSGADGAPSVLVGINPAAKDSFVVYNTESVDELLAMVEYGQSKSYTDLTGTTLTDTFYETRGLIRTNAISGIPSVYGGGNGIYIVDYNGDSAGITSYDGGGIFIDDFGAGGMFFSDNNGGGIYFADFQQGGFNVEIGTHSSDGGGEIYIANSGSGTGGGIFIGNRHGISGVSGAGDGDLELRNEGTGNMIHRLYSGLFQILDSGVAQGLPTSDPGVPGSLYQLTGVVMISL